MLHIAATLPNLARRLCIVLIVGVAVLTAGCGGDDDGGYPPQVKENFLSSCAGSGGTESQCSCAWDEITDTYSFEEYLQIEARVAAGSGGDELVPIIVECLES